MNPGDKVYCIKPFKNNKGEITVGKIYIISQVINFGEIEKIWIETSDSEYFNSGNMVFYHSNKIDISSLYDGIIFNKFFSLNQSHPALRKLKLETINPD